jgi:hypothetical protein
VRRYQCPRVVDTFLVSATPEPLIPCVISGSGELQERELGEAWVAGTETKSKSCGTTGQANDQRRVGEASRFALFRTKQTETVRLRRTAVTRHGSGGRRRSADAELWRPCWPDVARGDRAESGASPYRPRQTTARATIAGATRHGSGGASRLGAH